MKTMGPIPPRLEKAVTHRSPAGVRSDNPRSRAGPSRPLTPLALVTSSYTSALAVISATNTAAPTPALTRSAAFAPM